MIRLAVPFATLALALAACQDETAQTRPLPVELTQEAAGHYCQMTVLEHGGPKAQIHFAGNPHPIWFTQVRDAVAFTRLPEEPKDYVAIYVNDMARAENWDKPGVSNWIDVADAWFVIGSATVGGMGAPEAIPFGSRADAEAFAAAKGGAVLRFDAIPTEYVLAPVAGEPSAPETALPRAPVQLAENDR